MDTLFSLPPAERDYTRHNEEQQLVWDSYHKGSPIRVPMFLGVNPRVLLCDPAYNPRGVSFEEYWNDPDIMLRAQCEFAYFRRHFLPYDQPMGMPEDAWDIYVDPQNFGEAAWFGAEIKYIPGDVPDTRVLLTDDKKYMLFERGLPDPFSGVYGRVREYYEYFSSGKHTFMGLPVRVEPSALGTDGPFTIACNLRGAADFCIDLYEDPEYARQLLDYITEATIQRINALVSCYGLSKPDGMYLADDSIALLSQEDYETWVLPCHQRLVSAITTGKGGNKIHLCGDSTRHFVRMRDALRACHFDTGYPVKHGELAQALGGGVEIFGGPRVDILRNGTPEQVGNATRAILEEVKPHTKAFVLRDANNVPPRTPLSNLRVMYETVRQYGRYE